MSQFFENLYDDIQRIEALRQQHEYEQNAEQEKCDE